VKLTGALTRVPALVWAALAWVLLAAAPVRAEDLVVVVNEKAPVTRLSPQEVKEIYLGEAAYWGEIKIVPVSYADGAAIHGDFLRRVLRISENAFKTYWIKRIFREGGAPPRKLGSAAELLATIARTPGGVGYVYAGQMAGASGVREVLRVYE
jgi:ABC-type phosphate transport system substrate-binding protein